MVSSTWTTCWCSLLQRNRYLGCRLHFRWTHRR